MGYITIFTERISIHALREEGDADGARSIRPQQNFYPRPPRGGRPQWASTLSKTGDFYPRPPRGGRHRKAHVPLGTQYFYPRPPRGGRRRRRRKKTTQRHFYPRPPRGGRRRRRRKKTTQRHFYPRPPRGGRRVLRRGDPDPQPISIHALREEGDGVVSPKATVDITFLSTPSARRATAKTETKSLFSYKLYNILHEFRRALIYSGSKNYPNHAK